MQGGAQQGFWTVVHGEKCGDGGKKNQGQTFGAVGYRNGMRWTWVWGRWLSHKHWLLYFAKRFCINVWFILSNFTFVTDCMVEAKSLTMACSLPSPPLFSDVRN